MWLTVHFAKDPPSPHKKLDKATNDSEEEITTRVTFGELPEGLKHFSLLVVS